MLGKPVKSVLSKNNEKFLSIFPTPVPRGQDCLKQFLTPGPQRDGLVPGVVWGEGGGGVPAKHWTRFCQILSLSIFKISNCVKNVISSNICARLTSEITCVANRFCGNTLGEDGLFCFYTSNCRVTRRGPFFH